METWRSHLGTVVRFGGGVWRGCLKCTKHGAAHAMGHDARERELEPAGHR